MIILNMDWAEQILSDWNRSLGFRRQFQLSTEGKQKVLDLQIQRSWKEIKESPSAPVGVELSYFFEFVGLDDERFIAGHNTWGEATDEGDDEDEVEDEEKAALEVVVAAITAKRDAAQAFY
jgi:hypothetical protein